MLDIKIVPQTAIRVKKSKKTSTLTIQNNSMESMGYKIKTTRPRDYIVRPNMGLIMPMQYAEVEVTLSEGTMPDSDHKFLVEVHRFDWRRSLNDFKQYLRASSPKPCWTSRIGIMYEEEEANACTIKLKGDRGVVSLAIQTCFVIGILCLFYRFFE
ncbi:MSP (major sperm protein) domain-containing protein [Ordospora pajunii]|jgi:hypothetical protein|uniref:MSP (major sperm protein) domain-containing protein n=1 Tax=Ordospora pajunii TaxID=3039483 RepID=UPI0029526A2D|nr:MSP (major sperm protein) domain-containing protein [Ordospora pajunii]KAH9410592.1 MSP (major sperm protein) domain-containing protein [Ordospora pajunii]